MKTFAEIEELYSFRKVTYYSVRIEGAELDEMEKFIVRHKNVSEFKKEFEDLMAWIKYIGEKEGANLKLFRDESSAQALPPEYSEMRKRGMLKEIGYNLRLYCLRIDGNIVILLNGGVKTSQKVQDSPDLLSKFRLANKISEAVTKKFVIKELWVEGQELKGDFELIL